MDIRFDCVVALALFTAAAPACNWQADEPPESAARASDIDLPTPPRPGPWITTQLQARYFTDPIVRGNDVRVTTKDGVVTLRGTVPSEAAKDRAVTLARQTSGVARVEDQLTLESNPARPLARQADRQAANRDDPDAGPAWTTAKIQAQYFADPSVKGRHIDVSTDAAGVVTLRGRVDSAAAESIAVRIARATEGVARVVDELQVTTASDGSDAPAGVTEAGRDAWITASIQSKYFLDVDVKARHIDVETKNGVVTLAGEVETPAERRQALDLARTTDGVRDVIDRLKLEATTALTGDPKPPRAVVREVTGNAPMPAPPDSWITTTILSKCFLSSALESGQVEVSTRAGAVTLTGRVRSAEARATAEEIARGTKGVRSVVNRLVVAATEA